MREHDIVFDWLEHHGYELPTIAYPKGVIEFIKSSAAMFSFNEETQL